MVYQMQLGFCSGPVTEQLAGDVHVTSDSGTRPENNDMILQDVAAVNMEKL